MNAPECEITEDYVKAETGTWFLKDILSVSVRVKEFNLWQSILITAIFIFAIVLSTFAWPLIIAFGIGYMCFLGRKSHQLIVETKSGIATIIEIDSYTSSSAAKAKNTLNDYAMKINDRLNNRRLP